MARGRPRPQSPGASPGDLLATSWRDHRLSLTRLDLAPGSGREDLERAMKRAMKGHVLAKGRILGTYRK